MFLKPKKWKIKRTANYTEVEDISLVMASESVTLDVVTGAMIKPTRNIGNVLRKCVAHSCRNHHLAR